MKQDIELHIEELVLHGFAGYNKYQLAQAVELEITRLLQERGLPSVVHSRGLSVDRLNAGSFSVQPDTKASSVGNNIANSVYKGLAK